MNNAEILKTLRAKIKTIWNDPNYWEHEDTICTLGEKLASYIIKGDEVHCPYFLESGAAVMVEIFKTAQTLAEIEAAVTASCKEPAK